MVTTVSNFQIQCTLYFPTYFMGWDWIGWNEMDRNGYIWVSFGFLFGCDGNLLILKSEIAKPLFETKVKNSSCMWSPLYLLCSPCWMDRVVAKPPSPKLPTYSPVHDILYIFIYIHKPIKQPILKTTRRKIFRFFLLLLKDVKMLWGERNNETSWYVYRIRP